MGFNSGFKGLNTTGMSDLEEKKEKEILKKKKEKEHRLFP